MSLKAMAWAFDQQPGGPSSRALVFLHLANYADPTGLAFPHMDRIATQCEVGYKSVQRSLKSLDEIGLIQRVRVRKADGNWSGYLYRLPFPGAEAIDPANLPSWMTRTALPTGWCDAVPVASPVTTVRSSPVTTVRSVTTQGLTAQVLVLGDADATPHEGTPPSQDGSTTKMVANQGSLPTRTERDTPASVTTEILARQTELGLLDGPTPRLPQQRAAAALQALVEELGDGKGATRAAQQVIVELIEHVTDGPVPGPMWGHLGRLVKTHPPAKVAAAIAVALDAGAGLTGDHVTDPLALSRYATAVLRDSKATA